MFVMMMVAVMMSLLFPRVVATASTCGPTLVCFWYIFLLGFGQGGLGFEFPTVT